MKKAWAMDRAVGGSMFVLDLLSSILDSSISGL